MDEETRRAVDAIKARRREALQRRAAVQMQMQQQGDIEEEGEDGEGEEGEEDDEERKRKRERAAKEEEEDAAMSRAWTPTSAVEKAAEESAAGTAAESQQTSVDFAHGSVAAGSVMSSRRSSLRSNSALELDGMGSGAETPGPEHTADPLNMEEQGSAAGKEGGPKPSIYQ